MKYQVNLTERAESFLRGLDKGNQLRVRKKLHLLCENPKLGKPLTGDLAGMWSLRAGKYRCVYTIKNDDLVVIVIDIDHRKKIYDKRF